MRPVRYHWRFMVRDYSRLLLDDKWYWCRHCRRPVEHAMVSFPNGDPDQKALTCLDCGYADPDFLPVHHQHGSNTKHRRID